MSITVSLLIILVCLVLQGFFAASEMALVAVNRLRIRHLADSGDRKARSVQDMIQHPEKFLSTTLVGINLFLVLGAAVASSLCAQILVNRLDPAFFPIVATGVMLPLVLIFAEIVPKSLVRPRATEVSLALGRPLQVFYILLYPVVKAVALLSRGLVSLVGGRAQRRRLFASVDDLNFLMEEGQRQGALTEEERRMISRVFDFGETQVDDIMVPLIDIALAPEEARVGDIRKIVERTGHTRIPIYRERVDRIIGTVQATDLLTAEENEPIAGIIRKPFIVPESKPLEELLEELRTNNHNMAIVVDEYGGVSGLVTLENVIEEIVGDIHDEYDIEEDTEFRLRGGLADVSGRMRIDEINEILGLNLPEENEEETIAGFVIDLLGTIPSPGDRVSFDGHEFTVSKATDRQVLRLEIKGPAVSRLANRPGPGIDPGSHPGELRERR
ncbi:MAG TPA: hemolysin family protein [bacterium]|nr:hemolysin family protein [bacterium]HPJ71103.1 hemolysin family protein [bacterium]HPQ65442.1 hemolysin family protein [bacterium]